MLTVYALVALAVFALYWALWPDTPRFPLPPGPKGLPLVGNVRDMPAAGVPEYQHWLPYKETYGGVVAVRVLGLTMVIVHDRRAAHDLLESTATSRVTASRASMPFMSTLCGYDRMLLCMPYSRRFSQYRKMMHSELGTRTASARYNTAQMHGSLRQLLAIHARPDRLVETMSTCTTATILRMIYGYNVDDAHDAHDPLVALIETMMREFALAAVPMRWACDLLPALVHVPAWVPGATFRATARRCRQTFLEAAYVPYRWVQRHTTIASESYVARITAQLSSHGQKTLSSDDERAVVWTAQSMFAGASDTTVVTLYAFLIGAMLFPHIQATAQAEMDAVVGRGRLPTPDDRHRLPYVDAIVKETMRWWPLAPMGFPHKADANIDYTYDGVDMTIPKGALILPASWWFMNDPAVYRNPRDFEPARFLAPRNEPMPADAFGFGRRICPGRYFADASLFTSIAQLLAVYELEAVGDMASVGARAGIMAYPTDFQYKIRVRDDQAEQLLQQLKRDFVPEPTNGSDLASIWSDTNLLGGEQ